MKDALGNDIVIGNKYGYARIDKTGINRIKLGKIISQTPFGFALMKIDKQFSSMYQDQPVLDTKKYYKRVKVKPFLLFPI